MNEIVNMFLLAGDKVMPEMHLRQPGFTYSACRRFIKNRERIQKFKEKRDLQHIYKNELDKACFQHDMDYGDSKGLTRRTASDKILHHKAFNMDINVDLHQWSINFAMKLLHVVLLCLHNMRP